MKTRFTFPGDDYEVEIDFNANHKDPHMSLPGVVDAYAAHFPIAEATKEKLKSALYAQAASKINQSFRFQTGVLHLPMGEGNTYWVDIEFKQYYTSFCSFKAGQCWNRMKEGKHSVMLYIQDYMANGCINEYWKKEAKLKAKARS